MVTPDTVHPCQCGAGISGWAAAWITPECDGAGAGDELAVQPAATSAAAHDKARVTSVASGRRSALEAPRGNGMTAILPHQAGCADRAVPGCEPSAQAEAARCRSARARRYSSTTMSFSSWSEVSLVSLSKVISPCWSRFTRSQISSAWP